jgi:hypothetical protein
LPCDATQIGRFRSAIGEAGVEELLKATIDSRPCNIPKTRMNARFPVH